MKKITFKTGVLTGVFISLIFYYYVSTKLSKTTPLKAIDLGQIKTENLQKKAVHLKTGKPIIVNFWATTCAPCVKEFPDFENIKKKYGDRIEILMVSEEEIENLLKFKAKNNYDLNIIHNLKSNQSYGIESLPATYFYNSKGELVKKLIGNLNEEELNNEIKLLFR
ncbi:TlpA family protein disulfide reductase [Flavobacterium sp.]|uniref:TlpA family protein disulfide reductase n=1 Tax=Flavobacterium sp. TaxID=239 RepID=UPI00374DC1BE